MSNGHKSDVSLRQKILGVCIVLVIVTTMLISMSFLSQKKTSPAYGVPPSFSHVEATEMRKDGALPPYSDENLNTSNVTDGQVEGSPKRRQRRRILG